MGRQPYRRALRPGQVRSDDEADIRQEIELYLELRTDELAAGGMDREDARRVAEQRFGDTSAVAASLRREARTRRLKKLRTMMMGGLRQDIAFALRSFRRSPGFTFVAVLTLGLALGGNTAIFSVVDAAMLRALPFPNAESLVFVNGYHLANGEIAIRGASYPEFHDWEARTRGVSPMAAIANTGLAITGDGEAESLPAEIVSEAYFDILDVDAAVGRTFSPEEFNVLDGEGVVMISHGLWERRYALDPAVIGSTLTLDVQPFTVVGVLPEGFGGTSLRTDLWLPDARTGSLGFTGVFDQRGSRFLSVIGRLTSSPQTAQAELDDVARQLQAEYPEAHEDRFAQVQGFRDAYLGSTARVLWVLLGAGVVLLLIAASNVTNLLLVRSHGRTREIVLRRALGAATTRVARQLLSEGVVLALLGTLLGVAVSWLGLRVLGPMIPRGVLPGYVELTLSASTFGYSLAALAVVAIAMGFVPAIASARVQMSSALREGGRGASGSRTRLRVQHVFVVAQVALALMLMAGAGLMTRSFRAQLGVDTGAELEQVVAARISLPGARYPDANARRTFANELRRLASEMPGVTAAAVSSDLPFRGGSSGAYVYTAERPDERIRYHRHSISPEYFEALGIDVVMGRPFDATDVSEARGVGIITQAMVDRVFQGENPIGRTLYLASGARNPIEVVGVIEDVRYRDLTTSLMAEGNSPDVFFPYEQIPSGNLELSVRVQGDPAPYGQRLRALVASLDSEMPVFQPEPLLDGYRAQTATPRFAAFLMGLFSTVAALLACVGIYGVLAFTVGQRAHEIAIRRAIGASRGSVAGDVIRRALQLVGVGLIVGAVGAAIGTRAIRSLLFEVAPNDPVTYVSVSVLMLTVALAASVIPAIRAMHRDPVEALQSE